MLNLRKVDHADTKLVASVVTTIRMAPTTNVSVKIRLSSVVWKWIRFCKIDRVLRPYVTSHGAD
jgi:hypothetical protein